MNKHRNGYSTFKPKCISEEVQVISECSEIKKEEEDLNKTTQITNLNR